MVKIAAIQCALSDNLSENVEKIESFIREAKKQGAQIVLPSELFEGHYFCKEEKEAFFSRAHPVEGHPFLSRFQKLAADLKIVIPVSFFERAGQAHYNSIAMMHSDGSFLGIYRKSHIPDGPGYEEKYYFNPGDTGFKVWKTEFGNVGVGICWDQWYPECARSMALMGADVLLYPTAIGNEPGHTDLLVTKDRWQRAMVGHSVCNVMPVVAANRIGTEGTQSFYGHSFITDTAGTKVVELDEKKEGVLIAEADFTQNARTRAAWGFFRDRRPELYTNLLTYDGTHTRP
jgi:N-carbamoylputrescine amidase